MAWNNHPTGSRGFPNATRAAILTRDPICRCPSCRNCTPTRCTRPSTEADHIVAVIDGGNHDPSNGRGLCHQCHTRATQQLINARRPRQHRDHEPHPGMI